MILISSGGIGVCFFRYTVYCLNYVNGLIDALKYLRREIEFSETYLADALLKSAEYAGEAKTLFQKCGQDLQNSNTYILNEKADEKTKNICLFFFGQIGKNNLKNELKLIDITVEKLELLQREQKKFSDNTGKLWAKSGFLIGLILVILLT